ncbi:MULTISPECIES: TIGR03759 family integrating conjugative element protein [unclassified Modicisalibacter]|uniref:TIGR03759 family integrating conjugative element protein n=1 Tax=unclassified Modicisalibacter TaxID=2679913 RepID=UPI001CD030CD|nr:MULTISPECIES: TIGR03759 family integrating conjugative element protein [unclassified Modicisalibacter]MBZ9559052.1 TIGR03759 family integrating conjugative element protein [Modicisalibacter sp. R2A 31.J]MBZ9576837.1 TIGR03759 family integrating conjugative element protein [Modicisalibacter sp. MOD 31.J]
MTKRACLILIASLSCTVLSVEAQVPLSLDPPPGPSIQREALQRNRETEVDTSRIEHSRERTAKAWGLSEREYARYESIMSGPRGTWSPNLDPLTALGIEARSEEERQKYAEQLVETERRRVEAELAFQRAYDAAWQRLYPGEMPIKAFSTQKGGETRSLFDSDSRQVPGRLSVVVATQGCRQCDATVKRLLRGGAAMDIWVVDANGDDERIRSWASKVGIPARQVRDGDITLNHGESLDVDGDELPRVAPRG